MRILVVEDDTRLATVVARGLRKQAFAVDTAGDADEALFFAQTNAYDLMVLDVMLPGRDGFAVCRQLRADGWAAPILMLTARDSVEDKVSGLELGADDYLTKPFDFNELIARVRALMRRRHIYRSPKLAVGDLELNTAARTASRGGREIELTTKEYAVLEYLVENAGRVIGRAELAEHVWDENYDPFSNVIDVYIRRLRQKIDDGFSPRLIRTRRGAGYVVSADPVPTGSLEEI
jgi:two-component system, OmpR family, copper resistance phosphate regulon response regulator CusR